MKKELRRPDYIKVSELIARLQEMPQDATVFALSTFRTFWAMEEDFAPVEKIERDGDRVFLHAWDWEG
ncbi:MAG TPA: hypothetical protein VKU00_01685 [Chthonomonadaceae bacterium]|nr:hypothetical protein [Chthonomonadaceae bacterium]